jgi:hypothetical protein
MKLIIAMVVVLVGCDTHKPIATVGDKLEAAHYECLRDAAPVQNQWRARAMVDQCMESKGWTR